MKRGSVTLLAAAIAAMSAITAANAVEVLNEGDITAPYSAPATLKGAVYEGASVRGIVELKLGKVNEKKKTSKISGSVIGLDGKKHAIKAFVATGVDGASPKQASLEVKGLGTMSVTIGGGRFAGSLGAFHVQSATAGGNWTKTDSVVHVEVPDADLAKFAGAVVKDLLPNDEPVILSGGKWKFAKAAGVKWAKIKNGMTPFGGLKDEASGKGLLVDTSKGANLSGMKLAYTPKKGTFKGSFKVYSLEGSGAKTKLKKSTVKVSGVVADGVGYGKATCKKPSVTWNVSVGKAHKGVQLWAGGPYWAETNIGAEKPEDSGYYFWWGDTIGYKWENGSWVASDGSSSNFSFEVGNASTYGKDIATLKSEGWITADGVLTPEHDAAHAHWGGQWRMPTDAEVSALVSNCTTDWVTTNGVFGRLMTGKGDYEDRSIFLPAAGAGSGLSLSDLGSLGTCWAASTPNPSGGTSTDRAAWGFDFMLGYFAYGNYFSRYIGRSVRPVRSAAE